MKTQVEMRFSEFFEKWVCQLEEHVQQLLRVSNEKVVLNEEELKGLVSRVTAHFKKYYTVKWSGAHEDVLAFFCPVWLSPLENAYLWLTGWKPSTAFQLIEKMSLKKSTDRVPGGSLVNMSEEQVKKIEKLRVKIRMEEEKVEREMERQQVAMAERRMVELARIASRVRNGDVVAGQVDGLVEGALKGFLGGLERIMKAADCVRLITIKGVLEVLTPLQCVDFLAAICMPQIRLRQWGKKRGSHLQNEKIEHITEGKCYFHVLNSQK